MKLTYDYIEAIFRLKLSAFESKINAEIQKGIYNLGPTENEDIARPHYLSEKREWLSEIKGLYGGLKEKLIQTYIDMLFEAYRDKIKNNDSYAILYTAEVLSKFCDYSISEFEVPIDDGKVDLSNFLSDDLLNRNVDPHEDGSKYMVRDVLKLRSMGAPREREVQKRQLYNLLQAMSVE